MSSTKETAVCDVIRANIANLMSDRELFKTQLAACNAKIDGLREALDAIEKYTAVPKVKRPYKRRAKPAAAQELATSHAASLEKALSE